MADELLSAAELEALLAARATQSPSGARPPLTGLSVWPKAAESADPPRATILPYKRPEWPRLDDAAVRAVAVRHQRLALALAAESAALVRQPVQVKLAPLGQVSYREFVGRLDDPTCLSVLTPAPLEGHWVLEISPAILFPAIDCMLGGSGKGNLVRARALTDIELRLAGRIVNVFARQLAAVWKNAVALDLSVTRTACSPHCSAVAQPGENILWSRFELELTHARGMLNLGMPVASLQSLAAQLVGGTRGTAAAAEASPGDAVELVACLARSTIAAHDLANLAVGDTIATETDVAAPIEVFADGQLKFRARTGARQGHKALAIDEVVAEPADPPQPE